MKISEYLKTARNTDTLPSNNLSDEINPRLGLAGEIGYLLTTLKKEVRDDRPTAEATRDSVEDELGDILWYSVTIARRADLDFKNVLYGNLARIQADYSEPKHMPAPVKRKVLASGGELKDALNAGPEAIDTFRRYQELAFSTSQFRNKDALIPFLARVWQNAGQLLTPFSTTKPLTEKEILNHETISRALGDIMWYVAAFASVYDLSLDKVANRNQEKIRSAFPTNSQKIPTKLYDGDFGPLEQIPRQFRVDFQEADPSTAVMLINGVRVGDRLTDNAYSTIAEGRDVIDGYRFHDSIHLAFAAVLGWSPVTRSLLKCKRKSNSEIDEVEDGARAQIVEEMIVKIAHSYAVQCHPEDLLDHNKHVNLNLLKDIVMLADGLEVAGGRPCFRACQLWEWEKALLQGFKVYNELRRAQKGRLLIDLQQRCITFSALAPKEGTRIMFD